MHLRIKKWLDLNNQKASELAKNIGVNRATISHILSGRNKPSIDFLEKLLHVYPNINANWLITGVGSINLEDSDSISERNLSKVVVFYNDNTFDELQNKIL
ncbi:MAG: transcriptional regulator [Flavobacteriales bacterium]|jgi:transcriptional regulator with XRE-family HTH domain|nr:transcriptional regulator [Flavobacteriales bacterium]|tara:strand:+ start:569 stop:871 length:303 start_codon:yes stop_codon:yes gene_type:complete